MTWPPAVFVVNSLSLLILVAAYCYLWLGGRQPSMGLWGIGWIFYTGHVLTLGGSLTASNPTPWHFGSLAALAISGLMLWAGTHTFAGRPFSPRAYILLVPLIGWAAIVFVFFYLATVPIFVFSITADLVTARVLFRYSRATKGLVAPRAIATTYIAWAVLKMGHLLVLQESTALVLLLLTTNALALSLAFSLIVFSLVEADRNAQRRANRLNALASLTNVASRPVSPAELLTATLSELDHLLEVTSRMGAFITLEEEARLYLAAAQDFCPSCLLQRSGYPPAGYPCATAVTSGRLIHLADEAAGGCGTSCANIVIPILAGKKVGGIICVVTQPDYMLSEEERRTLETLGRQLGTALENIRLVKAMQAEMGRLRALTAASRQMAAALDLTTALEEISLAGMRAVAADRSAIYLYDSQHDQLTVGHAHNLSQDYQQFLTATFHNVPGSKILQEPDIVWIEDAWNDEAAQVMWEMARKEGFRSYIVAPLVHLQRMLGALVFYHDTVKRYSSEEKALCQALADYAATVLANALLYQEAQRRTEELTALHQIDLHVSSSLGLEQVLETISEQLQRVLGVSTLFIALYDAEEGILDVRQFLEEGQVRPPQQIKLSETTSLSGWVIRTGEPLWVNDLSAEQERLPVEALQVGAPTQSLAILPLIARGTVVGVLSVQSHEPHALDDSDRRLLTEIAVQAAIAIENARLYQQLEERTVQLAQVIRELEDLDRLRTELVQNVSHELRTPLTLIQGYAEFLLSGELGKIQPQQHGALEVIRERSRILSQLIHNLTALQALPHETLALAPVSLVNLVEQVLITYHRPAKRAGVQFETNLPGDLPTILADKEQLQLALSHLIDNAIKFSPQGGRVRLQAWAQSPWIYFSVEDEGIGIASQHLGRVFDRFYQVDGSTTRRFGGMGIGLAIVWQIVQAHQGNVTVESQPGQGSIFTIALPQNGRDAA